MKQESKKQLRKRVSLTIRNDVLRQAKELNLNVSRSAEEGIIMAAKKVQEAAWLEENKAAIEAHNKRIEEHEPLIRPGWFKGDW